MSFLFGLICSLISFALAFTCGVGTGYLLTKKNILR